MEKLNELVELAKKATSGEWSAFISTGGDGTFSIHTPDDSRKGDIVNWPGFDTANCSKTQKKANAKYIAAANPETILAIAEAFRALEKRAEAAEAKLAGLEKQKPAGYGVKRFDNGQFGSWLKSEGLAKGNDDYYVVPLYEHPAPAADLADLVPDEISFDSAIKVSSDMPGVIAKSFQVGANWMRSAILRNIEEAKTK